jgi:hypothetical protein
MCERGERFQVGWPRRHRILSAGWNVFTMQAIHDHPGGERVSLMKHMVRYKLKADRVSENERYVTQVFEELRRLAPPGLRYATFRLDDGVSFVHIVSHEAGEVGNALTSLPAFKAFTAGIRDRCEEMPVTVQLNEVGSYRFFDT